MKSLLMKALKRRNRVGRVGENIAARLLREKGYTVLDRNVRMKHGEIDIVARDGRQIVFAEVKTRTSKLYRPVSGWRPAQRKRLLLCAKEYIAKGELSSLVWRMELIEIVLGRWYYCRDIVHRQAAAGEYEIRTGKHAAVR